MQHYINEDLQLYHGECLELLKQLPTHSVDAVINDPPYGTTACAWDSIVPLYPLWRELRRVVKPRGAIVMTASQPFTSVLIASNLKDFRYCWVWEKERGVNFQQVKRQPLKSHEDVCVFGLESPHYYPQGLKRCSKILSNKGKGGRLGHVSSEKKRDTYKQEFTGYPKSVLKFNTERGYHPTQKPVPLIEYLVRTYSQEGETVLDFTMGSGTAGVAAVNAGRKFIGMELTEEYFRVSRQRILDAAGLPIPQD